VVNLELIQADTIILYEHDLNPFLQKRFQDKCYQIGISRNLSVCSMVSSNTIKENISNTTNELNSQPTFYQHFASQLLKGTYSNIVINDSVAEVSIDKISDQNFYKELTSIEDKKDAYFAKRLFQEFFNSSELNSSQENNGLTQYTSDTNETTSTTNQDMSKWEDFIENDIFQSIDLYIPTSILTTPVSRYAFLLMELLEEEREELLEEERMVPEEYVTNPQQHSLSISSEDESLFSETEAFLWYEEDATDLELHAISSKYGVSHVLDRRNYHSNSEEEDFHNLDIQNSNSDTSSDDNSNPIYQTMLPPYEDLDYMAKYFSCDGFKINLRICSSWVGPIICSTRL